ncbi:MAG: prepilin-type N-terminal cleavage/methylation domain-containing protein [Pelagibacterales bacterium]|nr:prepilin-type N-terminal cleavage/methylation domain-containing protein [Pelagibacterales bacterium]
MNKNSRKAFSLIEISIVILIIGILVAGVTQGSRIVNQSRITSARSLTKSSPVASIRDIALWLDTTSENSFIASEADDENKVTTWYDINPHVTTKTSFLSTNSTHSITSEAPTYRNGCINVLPCLYFNGTSTGLSVSIEGGGNLINTKNMSVFVVFSAPQSFGSSAADNKTIISSDTSTTNYASVYVDYQGNPNYYVNSGYGITSSTTSLSNSVKYVYSVIDDGSSSIYHYVNGSVANLSGASGDIMKPTGVSTIGFNTNSDGLTKSQFYEGGIGEIIIFYKALNTSDRKSVEDYLAKKWGIKIAS